MKVSMLSGISILDDQTQNMAAVKLAAAPMADVNVSIFISSFPLACLASSAWLPTP
jgi:hypothetical protein